MLELSTVGFWLPPGVVAVALAVKRSEGIEEVEFLVVFVVCDPKLPPPEEYIRTREELADNVRPIRLEGHFPQMAAGLLFEKSQGTISQAEYSNKRFVGMHAIVFQVMENENNYILVLSREPIELSDRDSTMVHKFLIGCWNYYS